MYFLSSYDDNPLLLTDMVKSLRLKDLIESILHILTPAESNTDLYPSCVSVFCAAFVIPLATTKCSLGSSPDAGRASARMEYILGLRAITSFMMWPGFSSENLPMTFLFSGL